VSQINDSSFACEPCSFRCLVVWLSVSRGASPKLAHRVSLLISCLYNDLGTWAYRSTACVRRSDQFSSQSETSRSTSDTSSSGTMPSDAASYTTRRRWYSSTDHISHQKRTARIRRTAVYGGRKQRETLRATSGCAQRAYQGRPLGRGTYALFSVVCSASSRSCSAS